MDIITIADSSVSENDGFSRVSFNNKPLTDRIGDELINAYASLSDEITAADFQPLVNACSSANIVMDPVKTAATFRENLSKQSSAMITHAWKMELEHKVSMLEFLKSASSSSKEWRPTGKTVSEQVRPIKIAAMQEKIVFLRNQVNAQKPILENLLSQVNTNREQMAANRKVREFFDYQISVHQTNVLEKCQEMKEFTKHIDALVDYPE